MERGLIVNSRSDRERDGQPFEEWTQTPPAETGNPEEVDPVESYPDAGEGAGRQGMETNQEVDSRDVAEEVDPDDLNEA